jgi:hypothetical protein
VETAAYVDRVRRCVWRSKMSNFPVMGSRTPTVGWTGLVGSINGRRGRIFESQVVVAASPKQQQGQALQSNCKTRNRDDVPPDSPICLSTTQYIYSFII